MQVDEGTAPQELRDLMPKGAEQQPQDRMPDPKPLQSTRSWHQTAGVIGAIARETIRHLFGKAVHLWKQVNMPLARKKLVGALMWTLKTVPLGLLIAVGAIAWLPLILWVLNGNPYYTRPGGDDLLDRHIMLSGIIFFAVFAIGTKLYKLIQWCKQQVEICVEAWADAQRNPAPIIVSITVAPPPNENEQ